MKNYLIKILLELILKFSKSTKIYNYLNKMNSIKSKHIKKNKF